MIKGAVLLPLVVLLTLPVLVVAVFLLLVLLPATAVQAVERWLDQAFQCLWAGW